jgi:hypothetical protein
MSQAFVVISFLFSKLWLTELPRRRPRSKRERKSAKANESFQKGVENESHNASEVVMQEGQLNASMAHFHTGALQANFDVSSVASVQHPSIQAQEDRTERNQHLQTMVQLLMQQLPRQSTAAHLRQEGNFNQHARPDEATSSIRSRSAAFLPYQVADEEKNTGSSDSYVQGFVNDAQNHNLQVISNLFLVSLQSGQTTDVQQSFQQFLELQNFRNTYESRSLPEASTQLSNRQVSQQQMQEQVGRVHIPLRREENSRLSEEPAPQRFSQVHLPFHQPSMQPFAPSHIDGNRNLSNSSQDLVYINDFLS